MTGKELESLDKKELRVLIREQTLPESDKAAADRRVTENLINTPEFSAAGSIFAFVGVGHEIDTSDIIKSALCAGKRVYVPFCLGKGIMKAVRLKAYDGLKPGMYGVPTVPDGDEISPDELELIIVPALCYDRRGYRLGRGGGYYDRYLKRISPGTVTIGLCRAGTLLDRINVMPHDVRVRVIVTDTEVIRT
ncbi:MAG: 5-formyltetrahydrofolate cyclo-ligase [Clostridiales bacterium]|jgi:5-formyltetrahydrofolate cyclo-ligase|nr:5-formyltetrahydrofolate cyclo-ligase [Clostridiales bacterium]